jgi:hypothetical protein
LSKEKEKFSLRQFAEKRLDGWNDLKTVVQRERKFSLRHFTEVLKTVRWMERFKNSCPEGKKNFHSDIVLRF